MENKFNKEDIDGLGKFKVEGRGEILNLIYYQHFKMIIKL